VGFGYDFGDQDPWGIAHALEYERIDPHNSYVAILCRTGIVGFVLLALVLWWTVRLLIRLKRQMQQHSDLFLIDSLLGCFVVLCIYASMNVTIENPYHGIFFWLLIGITASQAERLLNFNKEGFGMHTGQFLQTGLESEGQV
jgi:O-antigen ligase